MDLMTPTDCWPSLPHVLSLYAMLWTYWLNISKLYLTQITTVSKYSLCDYGCSLVKFSLTVNAHQKWNDAVLRSSCPELNMVNMLNCVKNNFSLIHLNAAIPVIQQRWQHRLQWNTRSPGKNVEWRWTFSAVWCNITQEGAALAHHIHEVHIPSELLF